MTSGVQGPSIDIAIPCFNEATTIAKVVADFRRVCPDAAIHVFDNASTDRSADLALAAGAVVHRVPFRGKGHVVRSIFRKLDADIVVIVDGDDTYPAEEVHRLVAPVATGQADMAVGTRLEEYSQASFRPMHVFGNRLIAGTIGTLFSTDLQDILSGYRAVSRRFRRTSPILSNGFEVETELTVQAIERNLYIVEVPVPYRERPPDSVSKLHTVKDGFRVLLTIFRIYRDFRPLVLFGGLGAIGVLAGLLAGFWVLQEFEQYQRVVGASRAVLAAGLCLSGVVCMTAGFILDSMNRRIRELYMLMADQMLPRD
jgi:glycosyltransferase involved in cell wall biosynthesis